MTHPGLDVLDPSELAGCAPTDPEAGFGALRTAAGNLPLRQLGVRAHLVGLTSRVELTQRFVNPRTEPVEATYVFPLPDRGAVTSLRMTAAGRTVDARLREREQARQEYDDAVAAGRRASIAEEERPDVFTLRVGNILPGEEVTVELTVVGVLPVADGAATFRFPLVVAPRYVPGVPLPGDAVGAGWQPDTDAVPDASRISPPVLLPGFPNPLRLDVEISIDPAGLELGEPRSSLHAVRLDEGTIRVEPGARADRDVVLRIPLGPSGRPEAALVLAPDGRGDEGTFELTVLPPNLAAVPRPRDVVLLLDRSGSMAGWKMVAARRAAARIVDTLNDHDRFAVLAFDDRVERPAGAGEGLAAASDRHRFRAVEFLAGLNARGGTELSEPLGQALSLLTDRHEEGSGHPSDRVLVLVTDGQVGNEDALLRAYAGGLGEVRVHTVGIDRAVNAGFLGRLAVLGGGRCELVESEDHLDDAMANIHRRIGSPLVTSVALAIDGLEVDPASTTPARLPDVFPGVPYVVRGRYRSTAGTGAGAVAVATLRGLASDGSGFTVEGRGQVRPEPSIGAAWARARLRDLEDALVSHSGGFGLGGGEGSGGSAALEQQIVSTSLRFGVLCRFTAFVAVDDRVVTDGGRPREIVQPVELPSGWQPPAPAQALALTGGIALGRGAAAPASAALPSPLRAAVPRGGLANRQRRFAAPSSVLGGAPRSEAAQGAPASSEEGQSASLPALLATEAARLRTLQGASEPVRRDALLDLGSRLRVLAAAEPDGRWREILELLAPDRLASTPLSNIWTAVLSLLDALLAGARSGEVPRGVPAGDTGGGERRREPFWKRRPTV